MSDANANLAREVVARVKDRARDLAKQIATSVGEPVDAEKVKRAKAIALWNMENPQADPMQVQQLIAEGKHSQALDLQYPWRNKLIGRGSPQKRVERAAQFARWASGGEEEPSG